MEPGRDFEALGSHGSVDGVIIGKMVGKPLGWGPLNHQPHIHLNHRPGTISRGPHNFPYDGVTRDTLMFWDLCHLCRCRFRGADRLQRCWKGNNGQIFGSMSEVSAGCKRACKYRNGIQVGEIPPRSLTVRP